MADKLWGGRFSKKTDPKVEAFTRSVHYDSSLAEYDVIGSLYHVSILKKSGLIKSSEAGRLKNGLKAILEEIKNGKFKYDKNAEDIHSVIQTKLEGKIGKTALKLHTARSRNDQVLFDVKLYTLDNLYETLEMSSKLIKALRDKTIKNKGLIVPGYTHMQHAQPISIVSLLGAYAEMLKRDNKKLLSIAQNIDITFGSGAVAGTSIPASCYKIKGLPFNKEMKPAVNSVDGVSDRDFIVETLSALAVIGMHLSRVAEDMIIWSTSEFAFVEMDDAYCTGSSLMPQKKNPDVMELIRGYSGKLYGNLISVLVMMKGLPLSYNRDMQLDKEPLFESFCIIRNALELTAGVVRTMKFNKDKINKQIRDESLYATDIAHYLVTKGVAFKDAHNVVGALVKHSLDNKIRIKDMPDKQLKRISKYFSASVMNRIIDPVQSVRSKISVKK